MQFKLMIKCIVGDDTLFIIRGPTNFIFRFYQYILFFNSQVSSSIFIHAFSFGFINVCLSILVSPYPIEYIINLPIVSVPLFCIYSPLNKKNL